MPEAFVILLHTGHGPTHYDLMLQRGGALATWQVRTDPADLAPGQHIPAMRLGDHREAYLTYEGPVSRGRGHVRRVEEGTWEAILLDNARWLFRLSGATCSGVFELRREQAEPAQWQLTLVE